jgi:hypothetical protein
VTLEVVEKHALNTIVCDMVLPPTVLTSEVVVPIFVRVPEATMKLATLARIRAIIEVEEG